MRREIYQARKAIAAESRRYPAHLMRLDDAEWQPKIAENVAAGMVPPLEVWRSRLYLVQIFDAPEPAIERITINRISPEKLDWADEIPWDTLQRLKRECGRAAWTAVEIFPAEVDVVNIANMRHLWVLPEVPAFAWRKNET